MPNLPSSVTSGDGGLQFRDVKDILSGVVDNGVDPDDPRVMTRTNEAISMAMSTMIPVGGMATYNVVADGGFLVLPPQLENCIEAYPLDAATTVRGDTDIAQGWYEIVNNSAYLDPNMHHDNPLIDMGLRPDTNDPSVLHRVYQYPGLSPGNATVVVTGKKRYLPIKTDDDYLIIQNIEALKLIILSIERNENSDPDDAPKYRSQAFELLEKEVKNHILDPRNYMRRKSAYFDDISNFPENTMGWVRANIAIDIDEAIKVGKQDLLWSINQIEKRIMQKGMYKDCLAQIQAEVTGGIVYLPINVSGVMAMDLAGCPIPIRSQFFQFLENGPGMFPTHNMLIDQGDEYFPGTQNLRRKYKLVADCATTQTANFLCKLRWMYKKPSDMMVIKNYEAIRMMMMAKFLEEKEDWKNAQANTATAFQLLDQELEQFLAGIRHTVHVQTGGFSLGDVGQCPL